MWKGCHQSFCLKVWYTRYFSYWRFSCCCLVTLCGSMSPATSYRCLRIWHGCKLIWCSLKNKCMSNKWKKICEHLSQKLNVKMSMKSQQLRKNLTKMIAKDMLSISSENQALYTYIKWVEWHWTWNDNYIQFHVLNCIRTFKNWERFVFFWNFYFPFGPLYWYLTGGTKGKTYLDLSKCCN